MTDPHPERPPFARHRVAYVAIKLAVLVGAVALAARWIGLW